MRPDDRVALLSEPCAGYAVLLAACAWAGLVYLGLDPRHTAAEFAHVLRLAGPAAALMRCEAADPRREARLRKAGAGRVVPF